MLASITHFSPIRMVAYVRNEVEMEVSVRNDGKEPLWVECDLQTPEAISLAPDRMLSHGRMRIGISLPNETLNKKIRIYGGASSYPDTYVLRLILFGYGKDGVIAERSEIKADLRCERIGGQ